MRPNMQQLRKKALGQSLPRPWSASEVFQRDIVAGWPDVGPSNNTRRKEAPIAFEVNKNPSPTHQREIKMVSLHWVLIYPRYVLPPQPSATSSHSLILSGGRRWPPCDI